MKKIIIIIVAIISVVGIALALPNKEKNYEYLRLHIRANSNNEVDQNVKYEVKSFLVDFLTPYLCKVDDKDEAIEVVEGMKNLIKIKCDYILREKGFRYSSNVKISNEYFPTRTYSNTTLESGYYDAVIVELGSAMGDHWWCVMYPPLCFVNKNENSIQINYKSKIVEWFESIFG